MHACKSVRLLLLTAAFADMRLYGADNAHACACAHLLLVGAAVLLMQPMPAHVRACYRWMPCC